MRFGKPPTTASKPPSRPPVRLGGQKSTQGKAIVDTGETRGAPGMVAQMQGRMGRGVGSTGKGPSSAGKPPARVRTPKGPGAGMLPGIAGLGLGAPPALAPAAMRPRVQTPILAIGQRPQLGARTKAAMAKGPPRPRTRA